MFPENPHNTLDSILLLQQILNSQSEKKYSLETLIDCVERAFYNGAIACAKNDLLQSFDGTVLVEESAKRYGRILLADLHKR